MPSLSARITENHPHLWWSLDGFPLEDSQISPESHPLRFYFRGMRRGTISIILGVEADFLNPTLSVLWHLPLYSTCCPWAWVSHVQSLQKINLQFPPGPVRWGEVRSDWFCIYRLPTRRFGFAIGHVSCLHAHPGEAPGGEMGLLTQYRPLPAPHQSTKSELALPAFPVAVSPLPFLFKFLFFGYYTS